MINLLTFNTYKSNISFGHIKKAENTSNSSERFINYSLSQQADSLISAYNDINNGIERLYRITKSRKLDENAKRIYKEVKNEYLREKGTSFLLKKDDKNILFSVQQDRGILIREQDIKSGEILKLTLIKDRKIASLDPQNSAQKIVFLKDKEKVETAEKYLTEIFEDLDFFMLKLRKKIVLPQFQEKITTAMSTVYTSYPSIKPITPKPKSAILDRVATETVGGVIESYQNVRKSLHSITTPKMRTKIKKEFPSAKENPPGSKALEFRGIGPNGEDMSVNFLVYEQDKFVVIKITPPEGNEKYMVVTQRGEIIKRHLHKFLRNQDICNNPDSLIYRGTGENDSVDYTKYLDVLKNELENYNEFINSKINALAKSKENYTTTISGSLKDMLPDIEAVHEKYLKYKKVTQAIRPIQKKHELQKKFHIESRQSQPALLLRDITPFNEHIFISFPIISKERYTKIILLDKDDNIKETFLIRKDKLVKFDAKNIHRSKRNDTEIHYHTQEVIDNSGLKDYLKMIDDRLTEALNK